MYRKTLNTKPGGAAAANTASRSQARVTLAAMAGGALSALALPALSAESVLEEIVVTGSRLPPTGFSTPTPVTVLGEERMQQLGITNVADALNQVPSFRPTMTPANNGLFFGTVGSNFVDLRGLGPTRTLVLVDGHRFVPSTTTGATDLNLIPSMLLKRTEVVTGGASAAYGSDAVSGVVNLILDKELNGIKGQLQSGIAEQGDNQSYQASFAAGLPFAGDRGHFIVGGEYYKNRGIGDVYSREWGRQEWQVVSNPTLGANGQARNVIAPNVHTGNMAPGGVIISGPLRGTAFTADGQTRAFNYGSLAAVGNLYMVGGEGYDSATFLKHVAMSVPVERYSGLAHLDYDFSDNLHSFFELSYGSSSGKVVSGQPRNFVPVPTALNNTLTIQRDNPYLPANLVTQMTALNLANVSVGRLSNDIGPARGFSENKTSRVATGISGDFAGIDWDAYYQYGRNDHYQQLDNTLNAARFRLAVDAVNSGGRIVCRSTLTNPGNGCAPINIIGESRFSAAAVDYVTGSSYQDLVTEQHVAAFGLSNTPFNTWAGPVSMATGIEYREDSAKASIDSVSATGGWQTGNTFALNGKIKVTEGYFETGVPLLSNKPLVQSLGLNGAVRETHYSTSGDVTTWKAGMNWEPVDSIRLRGTRSKDIRAPNIQELFTTQTFAANSIVDPRTNSQALTQVLGGGNPNLQPEEADTTTVGIVLTPAALVPGLRLSADYYDIKIAGAVGTLGPQNVVNRCYQGLTEFCPLINNGAGLSGPITSVFNGFLNFSSLRTKGLDIEALYNLPLRKLGGEMIFRVMATHVTELTLVDASGAVDRAGQTGVPVGDVGGPGPASLSSGGGGVPDWTVDGTVTYRRDPLTATLQAHYIAAGKFGATFIGPDDPNYNPTAVNSISDNTVEGRIYLNLSGSYDFTLAGDRVLQVFAGVNNLLDTDPPVAPGSHVTNPVLFDVAGRSYRLGLRLKL